MEFSSLQNGLLALIPQLERAGLGQIEGLAQLVSVAMVDVPLDLQGLKAFVQGLSVDRVRALVDFANRRFGPGTDGNASVVPKSAEYQFGVLYNIFLLKEMLTTLTFAQLTQLLDLIPPVQGATQLQHLQDLQQLLLQLEAGQFMQIKADIEQISRENPGEEMGALTQLVDLGVSHFHLYESLREMLSLNEEDFLSIQSTYPGWSHLHLGLLSKFKTLSLYELRDISKLLNPPVSSSNDQGEDDGMDVEEHSAGSLTSGARTTGALALQITDQPPEKCVYKRNVKPPPSITVEGDVALFDGTVYVVPILSRCDTAEDLPTMMAGNSPIKVTNTRTLTFGKLKILATTHQMNETMFALRFELRQYERNGQQFKLLDSVTTDPFTVVSHSTQLKPSHKNLPTVSEVIPYSGPPSGSTRVAILGVNFQDSPTTRVRFDNVEVIPIFHGAKTLLVHTPKHEPGVVQVFVCNEPNAWSLTAGSFTYHEPTSSSSDPASHKVRHAFQSANSPNSMQETFGSTSLFESMGAPKLGASQGMDFDLTSSSFMPRDPNKLDERGYAAIHDLAARGDYDGLKHLASTRGANPRVLDKNGNTCLHWAVCNGHMNLVHALIQSAPDLVHIANSEGETPLLLAARNGDDDNSLKIAALLIRAKAFVNQQDTRGLTALHLAVADGFDRMARLLLQSQANPRLATNEDSLTPLHLAAIYNRPVAIRLMSQTGLPMDLQDDQGETPLLWAYRFAAAQCILVLLALGANSAKTNFDGEAAVDFDAAKLSAPAPFVAPLADASSSVFDPDPMAVASESDELRRGPVCGSPARTPFLNQGLYVQ